MDPVVYEKERGSREALPEAIVIPRRPMDLWLSPYDARVRALREGGALGYASGSSPFGTWMAASYGDHLISLRFIENEEAGIAKLRMEWPNNTLSPSSETERLLEKSIDQPSEVPILAIGTPFQLTIWEFLRRSRSATTMTYGEVARAIGRPNAARPVGQAVGANNIALLIPCHRVISRGKLTGYRWGLDRKKALLAWELSRRDPLEMPF